MWIRKEIERAYTKQICIKTYKLWVYMINDLCCLDMILLLFFNIKKNGN